MAIKIKPQNKGKLHAAMGVPQGQKLSPSALSARKKTASPALKKEIVFAQNAKKWKKG